MLSIHADFRKKKITNESRSSSNNQLIITSGFHVILSEVEIKFKLHAQYSCSSTATLRFCNSIIDCYNYSPSYSLSKISS